MPASRSFFRWWETVGWERSKSGTSSQTQTLPACLRSTSTSCIRTGSPSAFATSAMRSACAALDVGIDDRLAAGLAGGRFCFGASSRSTAIYIHISIEMMICQCNQCSAAVTTSARGPLRLRPQRRPLADGRRAARQARRRTGSRCAPPARTRPTRSTRRRSRRWPRSAIDLSEEFPKPLTDEAVRAADVVITMGCGDACPIYPGKRYEDWELEDPAGKDLETVRRIRDEIEAPGPRLCSTSSATGVARPDLAPPRRGRGPRRVRARLRRLRRDRRRRGLRRRARRRSASRSSSGCDHGHGLRDRPPLRRPHQPGGDDRLRAHPALPGPRGRRLHRRPGRRRGRRGALSCSPSGPTSRPSSARRCRASASAARSSTRSS